ncbi:M20/M25/M40 family metallo-hydrolase [Glaciibacter sp. 2TAF33]|uniref:M20/M25/M40 family metallo-hydrolase n=1 Tax=Glaciibacter sp. 2TAF33 TaxID=3233015 RepID=UPI003F93F513
MSDVRLAARTAASTLKHSLADILSLTGELTSIDSGSFVPKGVDAVSEIVEQRLVPLGFEPTWRSIGVARGRALELVRNLAHEGVRLLVLGHSDTVWPEGTVAEWPVLLDGDRISGPGLGDMKCAIAMAVHAIEAALDLGMPGVASITMALVPDEELGSVDSRAWLEELGQRTDVCLTLESGLERGGVITSRGAVGAMIVTGTGRSAHSTEGTGISAVSALAPLVAELEALTDREAHAVCSVGILRGGTARQVVPDLCEIHLDLRARSDEAGRRLVEGVHALARERATAGVEIDVVGGITRHALVQQGSDPVFSLAADIASELGIELRRVAEMGGSDASIVGLHAPLFLDGLGPIAFAQCSREEWVDRSSVLPRTALLSALIVCAGSLSRGRGTPT